MAIERELWGETFSRNAIPPFLCPNCKKGRLVLDKQSLLIEEPGYSKEQHSHDAWEPDWIRERFVALLRCPMDHCGEVVAMLGHTRLEEIIDEDQNNWVHEQFLHPRCFHPAPPIITVPAETPNEIETEVELAFQLFWSDLGASASRLRTSVELLLDDFKIPREGKNRKAKPYRLSLQDRVVAFKSIDAGYATTLDALRIVGNVGTHEHNLDRETLLDAFEIYEDALSELYGKHKAKIDALRKKIIAKRGKS